MVVALIPTSPSQICYSQQLFVAPLWNFKETLLYSLPQHIYDMSSILQLWYNYKRIPPLLRTISIRPLLPLPQDAQVFIFLAFQLRHLGCWLFS